MCFKFYFNFCLLKMHWRHLFLSGTFGKRLLHFAVQFTDYYNKYDKAVIWCALFSVKYLGMNNVVTLKILHCLINTCFLLYEKVTTFFLCHVKWFAPEMLVLFFFTSPSSKEDVVCALRRHTHSTDLITWSGEFKSPHRAGGFCLYMCYISVVKKE